MLGERMPFANLQNTHAQLINSTLITQEKEEEKENSARPSSPLGGRLCFSSHNYLGPINHMLSGLLAEGNVGFY